MKKLFVYIFLNKKNIIWTIVSSLIFIYMCNMVNNMNIGLLSEQMNEIDVSVLKLNLLFLLANFSSSLFFIKFSAEIIFFLIILIPLSNVIDSLLKELNIVTLSRMNRIKWINSIYKYSVFFVLTLGILFLILILTIVKDYSLEGILLFFYFKVGVLVNVINIFIYLNIKYDDAMSSILLSISIYSLISICGGYIISLSTIYLLSLLLLLIIVFYIVYNVTKNTFVNKDIGGIL